MIIAVLVYYNDVYNGIIVIFFIVFSGVANYGISGLASRSDLWERDHRSNRLRRRGRFVLRGRARSGLCPKSRGRRDRKEDRNSVQNAVRECNRGAIPHVTAHVQYNANVRAACSNRGLHRSCLTSAISHSHATPRRSRSSAVGD